MLCDNSSGGIKGESAKPETTTGGKPATPTKPTKPTVPVKPGTKPTVPKVPGLPPCEECKPGKQVAGMYNN